MIKDRGVFDGREHKVAFEFYVNQFKSMYSELEKSVSENLSDSREKSLALSRLEESFFWVEQSVLMTTRTPPTKTTAALSKLVWSIDSSKPEDVAASAHSHGNKVS